MGDSPTRVGPAGPSGPSSHDEGFDQVLLRLRAVVERLEGGSLSLEQSLAAFEEGVRLSRQGAQILDAAERRVEILMARPETDARGEGGSAALVVPFEPDR
jgi:exodeoxyribonuclease VII small subunit